MTSYAIIVTPDAEADLCEIRDYITYQFQAPDVARRYIRSIRKEIERLTDMAGSVAPVPQEPWHSRGIRKIPARRFYVYYRIVESRQEVHILNVIYQMRDQTKALEDMK